MRPVFPGSADGSTRGSAGRTESFPGGVMFEAVLSGLVLRRRLAGNRMARRSVSSIGLYFGAVPGLSGLVGMAILLPFTFGMEPVSAFAFLLGMFAVTTTSDTIASVLLGIPGTAASQATILDGYPMAHAAARRHGPSARPSQCPRSAA